MKFRPCIDIHNGAVKQIVGKSLSDENNRASENFVSSQTAAYYAGLYKKDGLCGGHIILLNAKDSEAYRQDTAQALDALAAYPGGLQIGGGITDENASFFLEHGASHVIVTSFVFRNGMIDIKRLRRLSEKIGRSRLVLDLSCRKKGESYYVVTDRWQRFTETAVTPKTLHELSHYCAEFLIHAVDVEGCVSGIETDLIPILSSCGDVPVTYAGGISSMDDIRLLERLGGGRIDFTVGSALDLFGGSLSYRMLAKKF